MKNFQALIMPGGESVSTNVQQRERLREILKTQDLNFAHIIPKTRRWHQIMEAFVEAKIIKDSQWHR